MNRFQRKRRFIATFLRPRAIPRTRQERETHAHAHQENRHAISDEAPIGVTLPSRYCLPDSVLALICQRCEVVLYISRGHLAYLTSSQEILEALDSEQVDWLNPKHRPCHTIMRRISLEEGVVE